MEYRSLGKTGPAVSQVGLGCNNFGGRLDFDGTCAVVHKALDVGITLFDTADSYGNVGGSEDFLGRALGARRKEIVLATKFGWPLDKEKKLQGASRNYIMSAVEASLKRLGTDWIDLYQLHVPDPLTPIEETLRALDDLVRQGKVRYVGCSNFKAPELEAAQQAAKTHNLTAFISSQNQYSLLNRDVERTLIPMLEQHGLGLLPFSPLAGGLLSGKYQANAPLPENARLAKVQSSPFLSEANWRIVENLRTFCQKKNRTMLELAFSWLLAHSTVPSVIAGAMTPEQVEQNIHAAGWKLSAGEMAEIDELTRKA